MPTLTFPMASVIARLESIAELKLVGVAADLVAANTTAPRTAPALYVLTETVGGEIKFTGPPIQQDRTTQIKCVVWVRNHGEAQVVRTVMDNVLAAIDARFAGWSPGNAFEELRFRGARDEFAHGQYLVTQAIYESGWNFQANKQP